MAELVQFSWPTICRRFRVAFDKIFCRSKKAHFDCVSEEYRVVDGARTKWCSLLMMDALIFLLENDHFNPVSRRAFNQHDVFLRCVLEELRLPCPELHERYNSNVKLTHSVQFPAIAANGFRQEEVPFAARVVDLGTTSWQSMDTLRETCLSDPTAKSKGKFLCIIEELCQHSAFDNFHFNIALIIEASLEKAVYVLANPSCFYRANPVAINTSKNAAPENFKNKRSFRVLSMQQQATSDSSDSEDDSPDLFGLSSYNKHLKCDPSNHFSADPCSAFLPAATSAPGSRSNIFPANSFESMGSDKDDARPDRRGIRLANASGFATQRKAPRYCYSSSSSQHFSGGAVEESHSCNDGEIDEQFDLALFDLYQHNSKKRPRPVAEGNQRRVHFRTTAASAAAAVSTTVTMTSTSATTYGSFSAHDSNASQILKPVPTHSAAGSQYDAHTCADPCSMRPWDFLDEDRAHNSENHDFCAENGDFHDQLFPPCAIHSPDQAAHEAADSTPEDPQVAYERIIQLHEAEQSNNKEDTAAHSKVPFIDSSTSIVTPDNTMLKGSTPTANMHMQTDKTTKVKFAAQFGCSSSQQVTATVDGKPTLTTIHEQDDCHQGNSKPSFTPRETSISNGLAKLKLPSICSAPSATTATSGVHISAEDIAAVVPFPSPTNSALNMLYGTVTSYHRRSQSQL